MRAPRCAGLVKPSEGHRLATLAREVTPDRAIVEIGSHTGLSTCWMAAASRRGRGAHVTAVDPWADPRADPGEGCNDDPFGLGTGQSVYERFAQNVSAEGLDGRITPLRTTSLVAAHLWVQPVGLLFIDAIHEYEHVKSDYLHWQGHIAVGGWLAFHDYTTDPTHAYYGVARAIEEFVTPSCQWSEPIVTEYLWTARRIVAA